MTIKLHLVAGDTAIPAPHPVLTPQTIEKLSSTKLVLGSKKVRDCCCMGYRTYALGILLCECLSVLPSIGNDKSGVLNSVPASLIFYFISH